MPAKNMLVFGITLLGILGIGAWLVVKGHPIFGTFFLIIAFMLKYKHDPANDKKE